MKPCKLKKHLQSKHPEHANKDPGFFERKRSDLKRQRLDSTGVFKQELAAAVEASYSVSYLIAQKKKPHNIGEELILPAAKILVKEVVGKMQLRSLIMWPCQMIQFIEE